MKSDDDGVASFPLCGLRIGERRIGMEKESDRYNNVCSE